MSQTLPHIDQINESDMNLLTRLIKDYDGIAKPAGGRLVLVKKADAKSVSGQSLEQITLQPEQVSSGQLSISKREVAGSVVATWRDIEAAEDKSITIGEGEPVVRLKKVYPDQATARTAAVSELTRRERGKEKLNLSLPGNPALIAESKIVLQGFRDGLNREWLITSAEHNVNSAGYSCRLNCETPDSA
ncbi:contractile injection system protein, VgrG/Pvc8 family [Chromatiaceae bacterium AAb-1]|nr:contractile injection system protein, VgrG/Pvc8 family [Chromatiaceae bacterium AAb-1]